MSILDFLASLVVVGWFDEESFKLNDCDDVDKEGDAGCDMETVLVVGLLLFWLLVLLLLVVVVRWRFLVDFELSFITTKQTFP